MHKLEIDAFASSLRPQRSPVCPPTLGATSRRRRREGPPCATRPRLPGPGGGVSLRRDREHVLRRGPPPRGRSGPSVYLAARAHPAPSRRGDSVVVDINGLSPLGE